LHVFGRDALGGISKVFDCQKGKAEDFPALRDIAHGLVERSLGLTLLIVW